MCFDLDHIIYCLASQIHLFYQWRVLLIFLLWLIRVLLDLKKRINFWNLVDFLFLFKREISLIFFFRRLWVLLLLWEVVGLRVDSHRRMLLDWLLDYNRLLTFARIARVVYLYRQKIVLVVKPEILTESGLPQLSFAGGRALIPNAKQSNRWKKYCHLLRGLIRRINFFRCLFFMAQL